ncbi:MAG: PRTRC system protein C [Candidatus Competibacteraceae bacterium]|jgi:PRTRC genetic system protein C|nr:PRTRC system protein C [Candidatus Competibacteraceae bacterium]
MTDITTPQRVFKMGSVRLVDPDPRLPPEQAVRLYAPNYPHLATATLSGPEQVQDELVWTVEKPTVKTKG